MNDRRITCRYLDHLGNRCTGEVVDEDPTHIQLCIKHLSRALELINDRQASLAQVRAAARA